ncbi:MAG TPA: DUF4410 domain-containing protein [Candidatus Methylacidiphilales bacterium]
MNRSVYLLLPASAWLLAGCASVSVRPEPTAAVSSSRGLPPRQILVCPFDLDGAKVNAGRTADELTAFKTKMVGDLNRDLLHALAPLGLPAQIATSMPSGSSTPQPAWLIRGEFKTIDQGSRALRTFIGFGAGRTTLETEVQVYDLSVSGHAPVLTFATAGGSGSEPGAIVGATPVGLALTVPGKARAGLSNDTSRTARMIAAYVSTALAERGYIPADKARKAKLVKSASRAPPGDNNEGID